MNDRKGRLPEVIVLRMPAGQDELTSEEANKGTSHHDRMGAYAMDRTEEITKKYPEVRLALSLLWTPPRPIDTAPFHRSTHMALVSADDGIAPRELVAALDLFLSSILNYRSQLVGEANAQKLDG